MMDLTAPVGNHGVDIDVGDLGLIGGNGADVWGDGSGLDPEGEIEGID